ncbi:RNA polymerase sigma factor [Parasediminibacterium paludis]|uniref:RNA polymerase sigma factor n=1 Tax=Parasediminibacterium paludis TaxID=908966 RepID=A0ABV8PZC9_9BACT
METANHILTDLVKKARKGNAEAQSSLYHQFSKAMFNICIRMAGNRSDAEDILQDAFILAFKSLHQLKDALTFGGWLRRIVVNECIKHSKKSFYWQDWEEADHEHRTEDAVEWWQDIDMAIIHQQIKALPDGCRQVFNLYVLENYSHKQIAENLGISEGTSKSQYSRAKQLLKERITKHIALHG